MYITGRIAPLFYFIYQIFYCNQFTEEIPHGMDNSAENNKQILIPKGFAHGFSVLSETAEVMYKCDAFYNKESEGGVLFNDHGLSIDWKVPADKMILSEKDKLYPVFADVDHCFTLDRHPQNGHGWRQPQPAAHRR